MRSSSAISALVRRLRTRAKLSLSLGVGCGLFLVARGQEPVAPAGAGALDGVEEFLA
jgi:hypothetical protein